MEVILSLRITRNKLIGLREYPFFIILYHSFGSSISGYLLVGMRMRPPGLTSKKFNSSIPSCLPEVDVLPFGLFRTFSHISLRIADMPCSVLYNLTHEGCGLLAVLFACGNLTLTNSASSFVPFIHSSNIYCTPTILLRLFNYFVLGICYMYVIIIYTIEDFFWKYYYVQKISGLH